MLAVSDPAAVAIGVAMIAALGSIIAAYLGYLGLKATKTRNGHTLGEQADDIVDRLARLELWMVEHLQHHPGDHRWDHQ